MQKLATIFRFGPKIKRPRCSEATSLAFKKFKSGGNFNSSTNTTIGDLVTHHL